MKMKTITHYYLMKANFLIIQFWNNLINIIHQIKYHSRNKLRKHTINLTDPPNKYYKYTTNTQNNHINNEKKFFNINLNK